jgi:hypothetical protein
MATTTEQVRAESMHSKARGEFGIVPLKGARGAALLPPTLPFTLVNHGGQILTSVAVTTIFWGAHWETTGGAALRDYLNGFFDYILNSDFMDMLAEYSTPGHTIGSGARVGTFTVSDSEPGTPVPPPAVGREVTDAQIRTELQSLLQTAVVPAVTANSLYFVFLPPNVTSILPKIPKNWRSCTDFCGYHSAFNTTFSSSVFYAVAPFIDCGGCSFPGTIGEKLTLACSHELAEAVTDPRGNAWTADVGIQTEEIGDLCAGTSGTLGGYQLQPEWSNAQNACVLTSAAPWRHLGKLFAHPLQADFDCSGLANAARSVNVGDVDGDGYGEVVIQIDAAHSGGNDFWIMKYDTASRAWYHLSPIGGHALQADLDCSGLPNAARSVSVGDVDGDGQAEVVVQIDAAGSGGNDFWVMRYDAVKSGWAHLSPIPGHALQADFDCSGLPNGARSVHLGDVDGDGRAEVVIQIDAAHSGGNDFWVMKFNPATMSWDHLSPIAGHPLQADFDCSSLPNAARSVCVGDVDHDGRAEVVIQIDAALSGGNDFWVMKFDVRTRVWRHLSPIAGHTLEADLDCSGLPNAARSVCLGDVDGDGTSEVVVQIDAAHSGGNDFWVMKFDRNAVSWNHLSPIPGHALQADFDCSGLPNAARSVHVGDVDGDGRAEIVVQIDAHGSGGNDFWVMKYDPARVGWNHLTPIGGHPLQADFDCSGLQNAARAVSLADVDGDGRAEVVVQIDAAKSGGNDFWVMDLR